MAWSLPRWANAWCLLYAVQARVRTSDPLRSSASPAICYLISFHSLHSMSKRLRICGVRSAVDVLQKFQPLQSATVLCGAALWPQLAAGIAKAGMRLC